MIECGQIFQGSTAQLREFILQARSEGADVQMISHDTIWVKSAWLSDESEPPILPVAEVEAITVPKPAKAVPETKEGHSKSSKPPPLFGKVEV